MASVGRYARLLDIFIVPIPNLPGLPVAFSVAIALNDYDIDSGSLRTKGIDGATEARRMMVAKTLREPVVIQRRDTKTGKVRDAGDVV